jgi:hypothetical protein
MMCGICFQKNQVTKDICKIKENQIPDTCFCSFIMKMITNLKVKKIYKCEHIQICFPVSWFELSLQETAHAMYK